MTLITDWIEKNLYIPLGIQKNIITTIFIIVLMRILYTFLRKILYRLINNDRVYYKSKKSASFGTSIMGVILVSRVWFEGINSFMTFIGLFSAALAIVMKDVILNLAGWFYIIIKTPFKVGDRIEIDGTVGDVIDIQLFNTVIMEIRNWIYGDKYTGRIVYLPNFIIFNKPSYNFNSETGYIWNELKVAIDLTSDWKKAKGILEKIAIENTKDIIPMAEASIKTASRMFRLLDSDFKPKVYTQINSENSNITFIIRYICHYKRKRGSAQDIYEDILDAFSQYEDIEFSYPINRIYFENAHEVEKGT